MIKQGMRTLAMAALLCVTGTLCAEETKEERDTRMSWWREARFGLFIHWGAFSAHAGRLDGKTSGEGRCVWAMYNLKIPVADYAKIASQLNPTKFDAEEWAKLAKQAGMKYVVVTAKQHEGFAIFRTKASGFNIVDATPYKKDPLLALANACRKEGLRFGVYYSQAQDWYHPGGAVPYRIDGNWNWRYRGATAVEDPAPGRWDKAQDGDFDEYLHNIALPQVKELLTNYGPIDVLWWDTSYQMTKERAELFLPLLKLQPQIITNNRLALGFVARTNKELAGDFGTPEQQIPESGLPGQDWETCMTMNDNWGYIHNDNNWKTFERLLRNLIDIASKGGNYLLNIGPTAEGVIPQPSVDRLREFAKWMAVNGEAITGTSANPLKQSLPWGRATYRPGKLYLHVFDWPNTGVLQVPIRNRIQKAYMLAAPEHSLSATIRNDKVTVQLPVSALDPIASVLVLEFSGNLDPTPQG